ncbi:MAG: hypothetical protein ABIP95_04850 [Pelobium sp.]
MNKLVKGITVLICITVFSCGKNYDQIPDLPFSFQASINNQLPRLNAAGGVEVVSNNAIGVAGLILYKTNSGRIVAYDRCSSVNPSQKNKVEYVGGNLVEDKVSGAYFDLNDGSPAGAPAERPLRNYSVTINGDIIMVIN